MNQDNFNLIISPTKKDIKTYKKLGIIIPSKDDCLVLDNEIYYEGDTPYVTIPLIISEMNDDTSIKTYQLCLIVSKQKCICVLYDGETYDKLEFDKEQIDCGMSGIEVYQLIIQGLIDRIKEEVYSILQLKILDLSNKIFNYDTNKNTHSPRDTLKLIGRIGDHISIMSLFANKVHRSIDTIFCIHKQSLSQTEAYTLNDTSNKILKILKDNSALSDKTGFLLDSTLGFINIDQNNTMKLLTIASSVLIAPTLIAGIFGMNFSKIPLADEWYGFYICSFIMFILVAIPLIVFYRKGWFKSQ